MSETGRSYLFLRGDNPDVGDVQKAWDGEWTREDTRMMELMGDSNFRTFLVQRAVNRHIYGNEETMERGDAFYITKWHEAVNLDISVAEIIAGAATMLNMNNVMVPVFHSIPRGRDVVTFDMLRKSTESLMSMQLAPIQAALDVMKKKIQETENNDQVVQEIQNLLVSTETLDNRIDQMTKRTMDVITELSDEYIREQHKLRTLSPICHNSLSDVYLVTKDILGGMGVDWEEIIRDRQELSREFRLTTKEVMLVLARHPLTSMPFCKAAGGYLQATMNLRDGAYSGIRKSNANDMRAVSYVLMLKAHIRAHKEEIHRLFLNIVKKPWNYLQYFLDVVQGVRDNPFSKYLVKSTAPSLAALMEGRLEDDVVQSDPATTAAQEGPAQPNRDGVETRDGLDTRPKKRMIFSSKDEYIDLQKL